MAEAAQTLSFREGQSSNGLMIEKDYWPGESMSLLSKNLQAGPLRHQFSMLLFPLAASSAAKVPFVGLRNSKTAQHAAMQQ
jgi:hypothetical protein